MKEAKANSERGRPVLTEIIDFFTSEPDNVNDESYSSS